MEQDAHLRLARGCLSLINVMQAARAAECRKLEDARQTLEHQKNILHSILNNRAAFEVTCVAAN